MRQRIIFSLPASWLRETGERHKSVREPELSAGGEFIKVNQALDLKTLKTTAINQSGFTIIIETIKTIVTIKTSFLICRSSH